MKTWPVQLYGNGELQTDSRLTSEQIQLLTKTIEAFHEVNESLERLEVKDEN